MKNYTVTRTLIKLPPAEAQAHNKALAAEAATKCETYEDVVEMSIELAGHQSSLEYWAFRELLVDAWFAYNIKQICDEVEASNA